MGVWAVCGGGRVTVKAPLHSTLTVKVPLCSRAGKSLWKFYFHGAWAEGQLLRWRSTPCWPGKGPPLLKHWQVCCDNYICSGKPCHHWSRGDTLRVKVESTFLAFKSAPYCSNNLQKVTHFTKHLLVPGWVLHMPGIRATCQAQHMGYTCTIYAHSMCIVCAFRISAILQHSNLLVTGESHTWFLYIYIYI